MLRVFLRNVCNSNNRVGVVLIFFHSFVVRREFAAVYCAVVCVFCMDGVLFAVNARTLVQVSRCMPR